jgi:glycosyltransferase involved in cell wall biosynthesis
MRLAADLDVDLDVYGEASDADYDRRLRGLAGSDRRIRFAGTFASDAFADVVNAADLLVVPSIWYENSPLVLLQALALRCPVLVADVPGLAPHVRGLQDGWKFERGKRPGPCAEIAGNRERCDARKRYVAQRMNRERWRPILPTSGPNTRNASCKGLRNEVPGARRRRLHRVSRRGPAPGCRP